MQWFKGCIGHTFMTPQTSKWPWQIWPNIATMRKYGKKSAFFTAGLEPSEHNSCVVTVVTTGTIQETKAVSGLWWCSTWELFLNYTKWPGSYSLLISERYVVFFTAGTVMKAVSLYLNTEAILRCSQHQLSKVKKEY